MTLRSDINFEENKNYLPVLDHGFVGLVDHMGNDDSIVQAARVSYGTGTKKVSEDRGLIRYLVRHRHTTPLEMVDFKFHMKMPIFVMRQHVRHRMSSMNEYSGRYSVMSDEFYIPEIENLKPQSLTNKQGRDGAYFSDDAVEIQEQMNDVHRDAYKTYLNFINEDGINLARETSRAVLPVSNYTECYWKINLHNLFHYLNLRMDSHAQWEIRQFANALYELIKPIVPVAVEAFEDYIFEAETFSKQEMKIIKDTFSKATNEGYDLSSFGLSNREIEEFLRKTGYANKK